MPQSRDEVKLFVTDVDGTLTDGGIYYTAQGEYMKRFNIRDGMGLSLLRQSGVDVAIMTGEETEIVLRRAEKLQISHVFLGVKEKLPELRKLCQRLDVSLKHVAYVGDDVNDLEPMKEVGVSFAVADADSRVLEAASVRLSKRGGEGAVREAVEWILNRNERAPFSK